MEQSEFFLYITFIILILTVTVGCGEKDDFFIDSDSDANFTQAFDKNKNISNIYNSSSQDLSSYTKKYIDFNTAESKSIINKYSYDPIENIGKVVSEIDNNSDGLVDCMVFKFNIYDKDGNIIENLSEIDNNNDGLIDSINSKKYIYNSKGSVLQKTHEVDNNNDGIVDYVSIDSNVYDEKGCILEKTTRCDNNNDGITDSIDISSYTYKYNEDGTLLDVIIDLSSMEL
jgi:hypothetical protein